VAADFHAAIHDIDVLIDETFHSAPLDANITAVLGRLAIDEDNTAVALKVGGRDTQTPPAAFILSATSSTRTSIVVFLLIGIL